MYQQERQLQLLRSRFVQWLPWLQNATYAECRISPTGKGNGFIVIASWPENQEYRKVYDASTVLRQGRVRCVKEYAREFVEAVLKQRGVL